MTEIVIAIISALVASLSALLPFIIELKKIKAQQKSDTEAQIKKQEEQLLEFKKEITKTLQSHREEYLKGIDEVQDGITDLRSVYHNTVAVIELKIDNLEKKQDKHNSVIERTYHLESRADVLEEKVKVANNRIADLESKK